MTECQACKCGRLVTPERSTYSNGKWYVMCHNCILSTRNFPTPEEAVNAWNNHRFTRSTLLLQKPIRSVNDLDDDGCIDLVRAIYSRVIQDYEIALEHPEEPTEYEDKKCIRWRKEVETLYRYGFYTGSHLGNAGIDLLKRIISERAEERKKKAEEAKSREIQAS